MTVTTLSPSSTYTEYFAPDIGITTVPNEIVCGYWTFDNGSEFPYSTATGFAVFDTSSLDGQEITKVEVYRHFIAGTEGNLGGSRTLTNRIEGVSCYSAAGSTFTNDQWIELTSAAYTAINKTGDSTLRFDCNALLAIPFTQFSGPQLRITHSTPAPAVIYGASPMQLMVGS